MSKLILKNEQDFIEEMNLLKESIDYIHDILYEMNIHKETDTEFLRIGRDMTEVLDLYIAGIINKDSDAKKFANIRLRCYIKNLNKLGKKLDENNENETNS
ncbi:hypothetical protein [Clostridium sp. UBA7791]|uniref:hypothetical protein n=1 Tax=Clostridium sp. UBA7791 TaxID=1946379 RepID=UPI003216D67A